MGAEEIGTPWGWLSIHLSIKDLLPPAQLPSKSHLALGETGSSP